MPRSDDIAAREEMARDMAESERRQGRLPESRRNDSLAVSVLERVEHKRAERARCMRPRPQPAPNTPPGERHADRRARELGLEIVRAPDKPAPHPLAKADEKTLRYAERLNARVSLLLQKKERGPAGQPSWRERVLSVMALKASGAPQKRVSQELVQLCEESSFVFGDWRKEEPQRLHFT